MSNGMIWPFWKFEKKDGKRSKAFDIIFQGEKKEWRFANKPERQRICKCQECHTKIPREVPRLRFEATYHYDAGYYCLSCGVRKLQSKKEHFQWAKTRLENEMNAVDELQEIAKKIMEEEQYSKRMSLARMIQVVTETGEDH